MKINDQGTQCIEKHKFFSNAIGLGKKYKVTNISYCARLYTISKLDLNDYMINPV